MNFSDWPQWANKLASKETDERLMQAKPHQVVQVEDMGQASRVLQVVPEVALQPKKRGRPAKVKP